MRSFGMVSSSSPSSSFRPGRRRYMPGPIPNGRMTYEDSLRAVCFSVAILHQCRKLVGLHWMVVSKHVSAHVSAFGCEIDCSRTHHRKQCSFFFSKAQLMLSHKQCCGHINAELKTMPSVTIQCRRRMGAKLETLLGYNQH